MRERVISGTITVFDDILLLLVEKDLKKQFQWWGDDKIMTTSTDNVRIFISGQAEEDKVLLGASPHEKYIILMNDTLQADYRQSTSKIVDLEAQISELENDNENMEKGRTYMKGLLKNFVEITGWYRDIYERQYTIRKGIQEGVAGYRTKARKHLRILQGMMVIFMGVWCEYYSAVECIPVFGVITVMLAFQESTLWNLTICPYKSDTNKISNLKGEIDKADAAQDYIHTLIDCQ